MASTSASAPPAFAESPPVYEPLRAVKLGEVRALFSPECYRRSTWRTAAAFVFDLALYAVALGAVFAARGAPLVQLGVGVLMGPLVAFWFVWGHDAAHGALFKSARWAEIFGTIAMLPSLQMYRLWCFGHNKVHHGYTSLSAIDWIWRPLTVEEYRARSRVGRAVYRLERHPATCGLHYLVRVWWAGMIRYRPDQRRRARGFAVSKVATLVFVVVMSAVAYRFAGGWFGVVAAVVVPFLSFNYVIALIVYLHHTHPDVPFFVTRSEWTATIGQVACCTIVRTNRVLEFLMHHIFIHVPHHVDTRIPFYRLLRAWSDLPPSITQYVTEYRLRPSTVLGIFRQCKLYDFETRSWRQFRDAEAPGT